MAILTLRFDLQLQKLCVLLENSIIATVMYFLLQSDKLAMQHFYILSRKLSTHAN